MSYTQALVRLFSLHHEDSGDYSWQEAERWMKDGDEEGSWGRPNVALLSYDALTHMRRCFMKGVILLDTEAQTFDDICNEVTQLMGEQFQFDEIRTSAVLQTLRKKHRNKDDLPVLPNNRTSIKHKSFRHKKGLSALNKSSRRPSMFTTTVNQKSLNAMNGHTNPVMIPEDPEQEDDVPKPTTPHHYYSKQGGGGNRRKSITAALNVLSRVRHSIDAAMAGEVLDDDHLPIGTELTQVFAGVVPQLLKVRFALVRLKKPVVVPELSADIAPLRFLIVVLGPKEVLIDYQEVGRSVATLMSNPYFYSLVKAAEKTEDLVSSVDAFLNDSLVVPPGEVDETRPIKHTALVSDMRQRMRENVMRDNAPNLQQMKRVPSRVHEMMTEPLNAQQSQAALQMHSQHHRRDPLHATGRKFGGMIDDLRERLPYYKSDILDVFNWPCLATIVFLFITSVANAITFGTMMGDKMYGIMGVTEMLLGQCIVGVIVALFSAQPLLILSASGPVVLFEYSMLGVSKTWYPDNAAEHFFVMHLWASIFILLLCVLITAFDGAILLNYVTPFTEDVFTLMISFAFLKEIAYFVKSTYGYNPVQDITEYAEQFSSCVNKGQFHDIDGYNFSMIPLHGDFHQKIGNRSYEAYRLGKCEMYGQPDTFVVSLLLVVATFAIAWSIRRMKESVVLGRKARQVVGNSGIIIALLVMTFVTKTLFKEVHLQRVDIPPPNHLSLAEKRNMSIVVIQHMFNIDAWTIPMSALFAALIIPLLFTEMQVAQVLLRAKERALTKGSGGHHWDLIIVGVTCLVCGILGLPWMCAAVVHTVEHCESLSVVKHKSPNSPGVVVRVFEQRMTALIVALLTGACIYAAVIINSLTYAELYGVLLYLAIVNIHGIVYLERAWLTVTPVKFWPDKPYCQVVSTIRMHFYTFVQTVCLLGVTLIKYFPETSIVFPATIVILSCVRQYVLPYLFHHDDLHALDAHGDHHGELTLENYFDMVNANM